MREGGGRGRKPRGFFWGGSLISCALLPFVPLFSFSRGPEGSIFFELPPSFTSCMATLSLFLFFFNQRTCFTGTLMIALARRQGWEGVSLVGCGLGDWLLGLGTLGAPCVWVAGSLLSKFLLEWLALWTSGACWRWVI